MSGNTKTCGQCGVSVPAAMVRCRDCGHRFDAPVQTSGTRTSGVYRAAAENRSNKPEQNALSLEDMLSVAEDAETNSSSVFNISRSLKTDGKLRPASGPQSHNKPIPPQHQRSDESTVDVSPVQEPHSISEIYQSPFAQTDHQHKPRPTSTTQPVTQKKQPSQESSVVLNQNDTEVTSPLESPSGLRRTRERRRSDAASNFPLTLKAIKKAIKVSPPEISAPADEESSSGSVAKKNKARKKIVKASRQILETNYDEHGRAAINKMCDALEDLAEAGGEDAIQILTSYLTDKRPILRETAARSIGETRDQAAFETLIKQLVHESVDMRAAVASGLGAMGDRRAIGPLVCLADEDPQMSIRAADALVRIGESAVPQLIETAEERNATNVLTAIIALGRLEDARALEVLSNQTSNSSATIRSHAIEAIGRLGESKGIRYLVRGLSDKDLGVKLQSATALKRLGDKRAEDALIAALNDPDEEVREQVIIALSTCGNDAAVSALIPLLESTQNNILVAASETLGKLGDERAVPKLCELLNRTDIAEDRTFRIKILDSLRRLKNPAAMPALLHNLKDPQPEIRERVVDAIGPIGDESIVVELEAMLKEDRSEAVRAACAKALGDIGDAESVEALEVALSDTVQVRIKAAISLGQIGNPSAMLSLTAMLRDQMPEIRYHASQALAEIGDKRSIRPIEVLAVDSDPMVVRGAFKALQKLGDERSEKEILKAAKKRGKKSTTVKSSSVKMSDFVSLAVLKDLLWPEDIQQRAIILGSLGTVFAVMFGVLIYTLFPKQEKFIPRAFPLSVSFNQTGDKLVSGRSLGAMEIWEIGGQKPLSTVAIDLGPLNGVGYVTDDNIWIAFANKIVRYDGSKSIPVAEQPAKFVRLELSEDRTKSAIFDQNQTVYIYDTTTNQPVGSLSFQGYEHIEFSGSGKLFAAAANEEVKFFDLKANETGSIKVKGAIHSIGMSPDDSVLVINHGDKGMLTVVNPVDQTIIQEFKPPEPLIAGDIEFLTNQELLLFGVKSTAEKGIHQWTIGAEESKYIKDSPTLSPAAFDSNNQRIAYVIEENKEIYLFDLKAGQKSTLDIVR
ncbi:HEAT repeat domain-containing protein [Rubinisphaera italica]|uniref:Putative phycocyanin operon protein Z n=1 Tax=Rubinisphaera italica TaxID=2527969 RepID=A0A5C5XLR4_9PLAN|nr:HEAT repeat domain-containing protein [Rubinisphaera italica]TWT62662.1 putative phycocyanin operon protein Z [Rubinisphaera italica]